MWREVEVFGVLLPPVLAYGAAAVVVYLPVRWGVGRLRLWRFVWNPPLAEAGLFVCVLGSLMVLF